MRTISVDDDLYLNILQSAEEIGESASAILRRRLGLPALAASVIPAQPPNGTVRQQDTELLSLVADASFRRHRSVKDKYLAILSFLATKDPTEFERKVLQIKSGHRKYFAKTKQEVENSGKSTQPRPIPKSSFWALTNAATRQKRELLMRVLETLDYTPSVARQVAQVVEL